jgi:DNA-binding response OmpR family regulator
MKKILVVEDDKSMADAFNRKLTKAQFEVKLTYDGEEACDVLTSYTPDLILLDLMMPRKNGYQVLECLKNDQRLKDIPVIVATNLGQKEDLDKALALGADDCVVKTDLSMKELVKKIHTYLK